MLFGEGGTYFCIWCCWWRRWKPDATGRGIMTRRSVVKQRHADDRHAVARPKDSGDVPRPHCWNEQRMQVAGGGGIIVESIFLARPPSPFERQPGT